MAHEIIVGNVIFVFSECITCGCSYAVPKTMWDKQKRDGGFHHCPSGHEQGWSKQESETEKLRRERDRLKQDIARVEDEKREAVALANVKMENAEREMRKLKRRTAAGTCPCCQRTFSNMNIHMRKQHPGYVASAVIENVVPIKKRTTKS